MQLPQYRYNGTNGIVTVGCDTQHTYAPEVYVQVEQCV